MLNLSMPKIEYHYSIMTLRMKWMLMMERVVIVTNYEEK